MAYDKGLATRIREAIGDRSGLAEKQMFGGLAFLVHGNMACGVRGEDLIVRLAADAVESVQGEPGVRPFDLTGRPMKGWLLVAADGHTEDDDLRRWVDRGVATPPPCPQGAVIPLGDPFDPVPVAAEIDSEIRALPLRGPAGDPSRSLIRLDKTAATSAAAVSSVMSAKCSTSLIDRAAA